MYPPLGANELESELRLKLELSCCLQIKRKCLTSTGRQSSSSSANNKSELGKPIKRLVVVVVTLALLKLSESIVDAT